MLEELFRGALLDSAKRREAFPLGVIEKEALGKKQPMSFIDALHANTGISVIAEIKRASPSRGLLSNISEPTILAKKYENAGAAAISVLTEQRKFGGKPSDLQSVSNTVSLPTLRKDFIAEEYQILEAKAWGASCVLLIVAGLDKPLLQRLHAFTLDLGLSALVETHSEAEVEVANEIGAKLIGINARDLSTFELDKHLFGRLRPLVSDQAISVAESAVSDIHDVVAYRKAGADAVLIGETLVTAQDPALLLEEIRELI
jgi:indole-3-glycerol phosphate synthase